MELPGFARGGAEGLLPMFPSQRQSNVGFEGDVLAMGGGDVFDGPSLFCGCFVANLPQVVADAILSLFKADVFFRYLNASFAEEFEDVCVFNSRHEERSFPCFRIDGKPFFCSKAGGDALLAAEIFGGRAHGWGRNEFFISGGCFL